MEKANYRLAAVFVCFDNIPHQSQKTMASLWLFFRLWLRMNPTYEWKVFYICFPINKTVSLLQVECHHRSFNRIPSILNPAFWKHLFPFLFFIHTNAYSFFSFPWFLIFRHNCLRAVGPDPLKSPSWAPIYILTSAFASLWLMLASHTTPNNIPLLQIPKFCSSGILFRLLNQTKWSAYFFTGREFRFSVIQGSLRQLKIFSRSFRWIAFSSTFMG